MDRISTKGQMIDQLDLRKVPHSGFDRSNHNYGTGKLGAIIPVRLDEVYPGDRIKGRPEIVANFEPLVAPLMGSMVLKQESFFIPYIQLWRHAWKFFTGKNGFNDPMPSVSPAKIFDTYSRLVLYDFTGIGSSSESSFDAIIFNLSQLYASTNLNYVYTQTDFADGVGLYKNINDTFELWYRTIVNGENSVYGSRKMTDLVLPAYHILKSFAKSTYLFEVSSKLSAVAESIDTRRKLLLEFASNFGSVLTDFFNFFFGPSSLFDYLGWTVPYDLSFSTDNEIIDETYKNNGINNIIQKCLYDNIIQYGYSELGNVFSSLFSNVPLNFMPFKAYYLVWYWNYRDQLLETGILDPEEDEFLQTTITDNVILYCTMMRQRCWYKDTFTTALTNTGDGNLLVPTLDDVYGTTEYAYFNDDNDLLINTSDADAAFKAGASVCRITQGNLEYKVPMNYLSTGFYTSENSNADGSYISLDLFDRIKRLRSFLQKKLILGYEVDDVVYSSFMVRMSNMRQHVPELLGRGRDAVNINTIVNNTSTTEQIAGDRTATAYVHGVQSDMNYFSEDWGLTLTFMTILPIQSYAGGMQRLYLKRDVFDFMWPDFATMGMDAIYNCELAALGTRLSDSNGLKVFGYQGRYYDLKSRLDEEHGRLLTDLNYLTFSREWNDDNPPKLNYIFVHSWPRLDGFVLSDPTQDVFRYDCYNASAWERRLPVPSEIIY